MKKIDMKKELRHLYDASPKEVAVVDVPEMNFLMADGRGNPNTSPAFKDAVEALYALSYALKFMIKKGKQAVDFSVMPLEGLWWVDDMTVFAADKKEEWKWTVMIMQPEYVKRTLVNEAVLQVEKKKRLPVLAKVRFDRFCEGLSAQIMHLGPYSAEGPTVERLHDFIRENHYNLRGKHHEIYLGDPRRGAPDKMKTIIRQPIGAR
jgi:hypothetical protein